ncbi:MAG: hydrogen peroxide-dependent heme synthase [Verrucomicrobiota bacterium]
MSETVTPLIPTEGLNVLHLFFEVNHGAWEALSPEEKSRRKQELINTIQEAKGKEKTQISTASMIGRTDLGFMIIAPDLHEVNALEKKIHRSLGPDVLTLTYSYYSLTELSEYTQSETQYRETLTQKEKLAEGSPEFEQKLKAFQDRFNNYTYYRLYPNLPDWEFFCFYPMSKRRGEGQNWYAQDYEARYEMMVGHGTIGRKYAGKIQQVISGSVGLDDWEWGVSLFAHNPVDVKAILYEMRFDKVSRKYGEFGEFFTGLVLPLNLIYERLGL